MTSGPGPACDATTALPMAMPSRNAIGSASMCDGYTHTLALARAAGRSRLSIRPLKAIRAATSGGTIDFTDSVNDTALPGMYESGPMTTSSACGTRATISGIASTSCRTPFFSETVPTNMIRPSIGATVSRGWNTVVSTGFGTTSTAAAPSPSRSQVVSATNRLTPHRWSARRNDRRSIQVRHARGRRPSVTAKN
jgi:hypothetical protein